MPSALRWLLLAPAALTALFLCVALAIGIYNIAASYCPKELFIQEQCRASYMNTVKESLLLLAPPVTAGLMIVIATLTAPTNKTAVALATLLLGSAYALYLVLDSGYWLSFILTELVALGITGWLIRRYRSEI